MADQKALKKRLKVLMLRPENQICSDCPEKKPTWASLIVPPPDAPPGTTQIGAFCCLECSGSHRRLGVHISFVRSVNLDSWNEKQVRAMENGGNSKVNTIFEARLAQSGRPKPSHLANGPTRERFIRDKYERRKFYDPAGYAQPGNSGGAPVAPRSGHGPSRSRGDASDVARQRVASRQARMRPAQSQTEAPSQAPRRPVAQAPASAPVPMVDLLDFGAPSPAQAAPATPSQDPFAAPPAATPVRDPFASPAPATAVPAPVAPTPVAPTTSTPGHEFLTPTPAAPAPTPSSNASIMALFSSPAPQSGFGPAPVVAAGGMNPTAGNMMMMGGGMMPQQQQQQKQQPMMIPNMMMMNQQAGASNGPGNTQMTPQQQQQMMMQNMMMMQNQNAQMMGGMNPQQAMMMNQQGNAAGGSMMGGNPQMMMMNGMNGMMNNPQQQQNGGQFNNMMQGMAQMNMGGNTNMGMQQPPAPAQAGGFGGGAPMGGSAASPKNDPFSSLGGMNAFR